MDPKTPGQFYIAIRNINSEISDYYEGGSCQFLTVTFSHDDLKVEFAGSTIYQLSEDEDIEGKIESHLRKEVRGVIDDLGLQKPTAL